MSPRSQGSGPVDPARRRWLRGPLLAGLAAIVPGGAALAQAGAGGDIVLEGRRIAGRARVGGADLRLNGAGVRAVAWFKAFVAALYLDGPARTPAEAVATAGPKRLQMQLLHEVPAIELVKALRKGALRNTPANAQAALTPDLDELAARIEALGTLKKGDTLDLDWEPTRGVLLRLNGTLRAEVARADALFPAVLLAFIGERPYDQRLKTGLLAGRATRADATPAPSSSSSSGD